MASVLINVLFEFNFLECFRPVTTGGANGGIAPLEIHFAHQKISDPPLFSNYGPHVAPTRNNASYGPVTNQY